MKRWHSSSPSYIAHCSPVSCKKNSGSSSSRQVVSRTQIFLTDEQLLDMLLGRPEQLNHVREEGQQEQQQQAGSEQDADLLTDEQLLDMLLGRPQQLNHVQEHQQQQEQHCHNHLQQQQQPVIEDTLSAGLELIPKDAQYEGQQDGQHIFSFTHYQGHNLPMSLWQAGSRHDSSQGSSSGAAEAENPFGYRALPRQYHPRNHRQAQRSVTAVMNGRSLRASFDDAAPAPPLPCAPVRCLPPIAQPTRMFRKPASLHTSFSSLRCY